MIGCELFMIFFIFLNSFKLFDMSLLFWIFVFIEKLRVLCFENCIVMVEIFYFWVVSCW